MRKQLWTRLSAAALAVLLATALPAEALAADQAGAAAPTEEAPLVEEAPQTAPSAPQESQPEASTVAIDETNFPDANFRAYVKTLKGGDDGIFTPDEIAAIERIDRGDYNINSLKGIEHFTALKELHCHNNQLTSLDVSKNSALTVLKCSGNPLTSLDVSQNTKLEWLRCSNTGLTSLDLAANTELVGLECNNNRLTGLNVSNNIKLDVLECQRSQLRSLDLSKNAVLTDLKVMNNNLTTLDTSHNPELLTLNCFGNYSLKIDVSKNTKLKYLDCSGTSPITLDVTNNTALEHLSCYNSALTSLDVSKNPKLNVLRCNSNWLTSLDVSQNTALLQLECQSNQLMGLDLTNNTALTILKCQENKLTFLNLADSANLTTFENYQQAACPVYCNVPLQNYLKGFDVNKVEASSIQGGNFDGGTVNYIGDNISYQYDIGNGSKLECSMARVHFITKATGQAPTCAAAGWKDYYHCFGCGAAYKDQEGTQAIDNLETWKTGEGKLDKLSSHTPADEWSHDATNHWKVCSVCNSPTKQAPHTYGDWETVTLPTQTTEGLKKHTCTACNYEETSTIPVLPPSHGCGSSITLVTGKKPTCTAEGWKDYYQCSGCGQRFENQDGTEEIPDLDAWKTGKGKLEKIPHTTGEWMHNDTQHWKVCSVCSATTEQAPPYLWRLGDRDSANRNHRRAPKAYLQGLRIRGGEQTSCDPPLLRRRLQRRRVLQRELCGDETRWNHHYHKARRHHHHPKA